MDATFTRGWRGARNSDPVDVALSFSGDSNVAVDADMSNDDEITIDVAWGSGKLNAILIYSPFAVTLSFNYSATPQNITLPAGGCFDWHNLSGIANPLTGAISGLKITRANPSEGDDDNEVNIRYNKDATTS